MGPLEFQKFLNSMSISQLQDYLEAVWRGEVELTPTEEWHLQERLRQLSLSTEDKRNYIVVWLVLLAMMKSVPEYDGPIRRIFDLLPPVDPKKTVNLAELVWVWRTERDDRVCPLCAPLDGKIWGEEIFEVPDLHPGCRCEIVELPRGSRAMNIGILEAGTIRAVKDGKARILEVLAAPFGSYKRKDKLGQFLSANTDYMLEIGDRRPLLYYHGYTPRGRAINQPKSIGLATATKIDKKGLWMRAELDNSELSTRTWEAALAGKARASTGSVNYLERHDKITGEVLCWPIAELSVFDSGDKRIPVSDDAVVLPLRALFTEHDIDYTFEAGEDKDDNKRANRLEKEEINMNEVQKAVDEALAARDAAEKAEVAKEAALRTKIEEELKETPSYRATFNIGGKVAKKAKLSREDEADGFDLADVEENDEYLWSLRHPRQSGMAIRAKRDLDETTAAEGLAFTPDKTLHKIGDYRQAKSFGRRAGMSILQTDSLVLDIPMATTSIVTLPAIAEEAVYTDLEPVFATVTATIEKHGGYVDITEELREDQNLFEPWLYKAIGEALGLAENVSVAAVLVTGAGVANAAVGVQTKTETIAWYHALAGEYREGASFFMPEDLLIYLRSAESANAPTYSGASGFQYGLGERPQEMFMGKPVFTDTNMPAWVAAAAATECAAFSNLKAGYYFVERRGINILVDPYIGGLNGIVRYYFSARYDFVEIDPNATALKNGGP